MLIWIDIETTGLDVASCKLLEIATVITDNQLTVLDQTKDVISTAVVARGMADPYVQGMHDRNGLWVEAQKSQTSLAWAEEQALQLVRRYTEAKHAPLCGSTVSFDRLFLKEYMPALEAHFSHRHVDVSSLSELVQRWFPDVYSKRPRGDAHRAMPDILQSIELAKFYKANVFR